MLLAATAAVVNADGEINENTRERQIVNYRCNIKISVGKILVSCENGDKFKHVAEPIA